MTVWMATLVRNAWYVAAWSREIDDKLRRFEILGEPVLLYRRTNGTVAALLDRCPHRLLPLSKGKRIGDEVQCGYHGLTFGPDGKCTRVPGQDKIPPSAFVDAYPVEERNNIIWIWIRDAEPIGFFKGFGGFTGNVDRWHYYYLYSPRTAVIDFGLAPTEMAIPEDERDRGNRVFALHFMTPVNENYTIDRWMHLRNTAIETEEASARMDEMFKVAFSEDKEILEAVHVEENRPQKRRPIRIAIDRGPMVYRKRVAEMLERERTHDASAAGNGAYVYHD